MRIKTNCYGKYGELLGCVYKDEASKDWIAEPVNGSSVHGALTKNGAMARLRGMQPQYTADQIHDLATAHISYGDSEPGNPYADLLPGDLT